LKDETEDELTKKYKRFVVTDNQDLKTILPVKPDMKFNAKFLWSILKALIRKDLSKVSLPLFINEPMSIL